MLKTIMPFFIKWFFLFSYKYFPKFICEKCSLFMSFNALSWLVGPSERFDLIPSSSNINVISSNKTVADYVITNRTIETILPSTWLSGVKLLECRYLRESGILYIYNILYILMSIIYL